MFPPVAVDRQGRAAVAVDDVDVGQPTDGTVTVIDGIVTYTPSPDFVGQVTVTYVVVDEAGASATGTLTITVVEA